MLGIMAIITNRNKPVDWFPTDIAGIFQMMNLGGTGATIHATPIIPFENRIAFALPIIRFKIIVSVIISSSFAPQIIKPNSAHKEKNTVA
jgi:hypothetical protein